MLTLDSPQLLNGADIVHRNYDSLRNRWIVLAKYGNEYVTWICDNQGNASAGHYYRENEFDIAYRDYLSRTSRY